MKTKGLYRDNGAIGALLDEYQKALNELKKTIKNITEDELIKVADPITSDQDCKSIQSMLTHVVESGYTYVIEIRKWFGEAIEYKNKELLGSIKDYQLALDQMFLYNEKLFEDFPNIIIEEYSPIKKIKVRWGQQYDVEQLFEHAIVHILRHRRQIERFKIKLRASCHQL